MLTDDLDLSRLRALAASVRSPWLKALALSWAPIIGLAVVATGNHFLFDIAAGVVVTVAVVALLAVPLAAPLFY